MNQRIKELAEQAWKEAYNVDPADPRIARAHKAMEEGMEKFAELIIKECIGIVKQRWINPDEDVIAEEIKQHFRVEK
jgi:hypothetical protein